MLTFSCIQLSHYGNGFPTNNKKNDNNKNKDFQSNNAIAQISYWRTLGDCDNDEMLPRW